MRARAAATAARGASDAAAATDDTAAADAHQAIAEAKEGRGGETEKGNSDMYAGMVADAQQAIDDENQRQIDVVGARTAAMASYMNTDADATNAETAADRCRGDRSRFSRCYSCQSGRDGRAGNCGCRKDRA